MTFDPPLALNPLPDAATSEIVMFVVPTSVRITPWVAEFPTGKFPKLRLVELGVSGDDAVSPPGFPFPADEPPDPGTRPHPAAPIAIPTIIAIARRARGELICLRA